MKYTVSYPMPEHLRKLFPDVEHVTVECEFASDVEGKGTLLRLGYVTMYHHVWASTQTRLPKDIVLMTAEQIFELGKELYDSDFEREAVKQFSSRFETNPDFSFERDRDRRLEA